MKNITGKDLERMGLPPGPAYKVALEQFRNSGLDMQAIASLVQSLMACPESCIVHPVLGPIAAKLVEKPASSAEHSLSPSGCPVKVFGGSLVSQGTIRQIEVASRLPMAVQAAIMPDGHEGYGIPIGGVLATVNSVIPYAVGVDIGCRMQMTVFDVPGNRIAGLQGRLENILRDNTFFGVGCEAPRVEHPILDDVRFRNVAEAGKLHHIAVRQLGTSGAGNHFIEFGSVTVEGIEGEKLAVLSHSGSRGFGNKLAMFYCKLAMEVCRLPKEAKHLAWLTMDSAEGQEYWNAMELAGDYAKANHDVIHRRIAKALKEGSLMTIDNHHNFAWKETLADGREVVVHRKGATPASWGTKAIIPGSMSTPTFIVTGKGNPDSISSSSHGAGRAMSRTDAKQRFTRSAMEKNLAAAGVILLGGTVDECSMAYKDIEAVMGCQDAFVSIIGRFMPKIVMMSSEKEEAE